MFEFPEDLNSSSGGGGDKVAPPSDKAELPPPLPLRESCDVGATPPPMPAPVESPVKMPGVFTVK